MSVKAPGGFRRLEWGQEPRGFIHLLLGDSQTGVRADTEVAGLLSPA